MIYLLISEKRQKSHQSLPTCCSVQRQWWRGIKHRQKINSETTINIITVKFRTYIPCQVTQGLLDYWNLQHYIQDHLSAKSSCKCLTWNSLQTAKNHVTNTQTTISTTTFRFTFVSEVSSMFPKLNKSLERLELQVSSLNATTCYAFAKENQRLITQLIIKKC